MVEHLRAIRADVSDIKDRLAQVEINLSMLGQQLGALTTAVYGSKPDLDALRRCVERIERRLDLTDA